MVPFFVILGVLVIAGSVAIALAVEKAKRRRLMDKYGDAEIVNAIMRHRIWQDQTPEQLRDSIGSPVVIDRKVLKTKTKEIWKYDQSAKNRFNLKVTIENELVVGWDKKG